jgi:hypothetical protein
MTRPLRTPVLALAAIALGLLVVGAILLAGRVGVPDATPTPATTVSPSPSASASADPLATPEGAVRTFFAALADARRTDEPSPLLGLVTGPTSSAYLTASGFLEGQKASGIASVLTVNELRNLVVVPDGLRATVTFLHRQTGFDIDPTTGQPKESPTALPDVTVRVVVVRTGDRWLVDSFENVP